MRSAVCLGVSDEWQSIHAVAAHRRPGRKVPRPLAILFRQEDPYVLLARRICPARLEGQSRRVRSLSGEPFKEIGRASCRKESRYRRARRQEEKKDKNKR